MNAVERAVQWRVGDKWSKVHRVYLGRAVCGTEVGPLVTALDRKGLDGALFYGGLCPNCYTPEPTEEEAE